MAMNIDFKNLDVKNLSQKSKPVQLGVAGLVIVVVLVIAYFALFSDLYQKINALKQEEVTLKDTFKEKVAQTTNLEELQNELVQINQSFQTLLKQLPTEAEIPNLIQELHQAAASNGLRMDSLTPTKNPADDSDDVSTDTASGDGKTSKVKVIKTLSYSISITGNYQQISDFIHSVGNLSRIVTLNHLNLKSTNKNNMLTLSAIANTYQALSDAEIKALMDAEKKDK